MRVMVAIDDSDESFYALQWVLDNPFSRLMTAPPPPAAAAAAGHDSGSGLLTLVHVQQPFQPYGFPAASSAGVSVFYPTSTVVYSVRKSQEEISAALLSRALNMCRDKMIKAETLILEGDPKDKICEISEEMNVDLLVVGSRGLGKIKRAFLGSVSDYCAHHANCPTLIVKPPPKEASSNK
ncbi:Universal stress protein A [Corchorus capsularis]|uniref:Universal stress protein A n=1 Tax=Corchorus capsularis TaxID=210143 RepID=A0A1R3G1I1_COCAP|nr:Universal stress protein A [Corchorus capsularis]